MYSRIKFRSSVGHFDASLWWLFVVVCWLPGSQALWSGEFLEFLQLPCSGQLECDSATKRLFQIAFLAFVFIYLFFFFHLYHLNIIYERHNKKRIPLKNVAKTTCQPPYCCLILNLRIDQENCIEEIQMTNEGGYIICSKALIWTQISFRRSKNYFKTTLKKAQRVIKTWQMTLIVNIYTLQLSL